MSCLQTEITRLFGIEHPILLAGMGKAAGYKLAAAVSNAGGLGVIGGISMTPEILEIQLKSLKKLLNNPNLPFGVDLLLPKVGGNARKTNYDYTYGKLDKLIDVIINCKCKLFVSAVGVPPKYVIDKLHKNNIYVMNMVGAPKHVIKACNLGVDIICVQGSEAGGHTGTIPTSLLIPKCCDIIQKYNFKSPLTGKLCPVIGSGGIYCGRSLAMALALGAEAVWVGTRFVCATEASASMEHKKAIVNADYDDTRRSLIFTGRPVRAIKNKYHIEWDENKPKERDEMLKKGLIPVNYKKIKKYARPHFSGIVCGAIDDIIPANIIIRNMIEEAVIMCQKLGKSVKISKL